MKHTRTPKSVLRPWVSQLTLQKQGTLLTAVRGPDAEAKESPSKAVVRAIRAVIMVNAKDLSHNDKFMGDGSGVLETEAFRAFFKSLDQYPFHWFGHLLHAAEIIAYEHPNRIISSAWTKFYNEAVDALHLNAETAVQMCDRLQSDGNMEPSTMCDICGFCQIVKLPVPRCGNCLAEVDTTTPVESGTPVLNRLDTPPADPDGVDLSDEAIQSMIAFTRNS